MGEQRRPAPGITPSSSVTHRGKRPQSSPRANVGMRPDGAENPEASDTTATPKLEEHLAY